MISSQFIVFDDIHMFSALTPNMQKDFKIFISNLLRRSKKTKIIFVGRDIPDIIKELKDIITFLKVNGFSRKGYRDYLLKVLHLPSYEIEQMRSFYELTRGHPLTLNMLSILIRRYPFDKVEKLLLEEIKRFIITDVYKSLDEQEKEFIAFLSIFREPVDFSVFEINFDEKTILTVLGSLIDKNLIEVRESVYYSIHPLIREVIYSSLSYSIRRKHHFVAYKYYFRQRDYIKSLEHATKSGDIRAIELTYDRSIEQMKTLGLYEHVKLLLKLILNFKISAIMKGKCLKDLAFAFLRTGEKEEAYKLYKKALLLLKGPNAVRDVVEVYRYLADIEHMEDNYREAIKIAQQGIEKASLLPSNDPTKVYMESQLAHIELHVSPKKALKLFRKIIKKQKVSNNRIMADISYMLGDALIVCEEYDEALQVLENALSYARKCSYLRGQANVLRRKADILARMCLFEEAFTNCETAEKLYLQMEERGYAYLLNTKGEIYRLQGDYEEAEKYYKDALEMAKRIKNSNRVAHSMFGLAETLRLEGAINNHLYNEACKIYKEINSTWGLVNVYIAKALASLRDENEREFVTYISKAEDLIETSSEGWQLSKERELINKIKKERDPYEKHPLIFP